jgi:uncharacterized phage protein (TIGR01671 family)
MREIKFRAWDNTPHKGDSSVKAEMIYDVLVGSEGYYIDDYGFESDIPVMQYTGLKDKNGVEIYEGDIFKTDNYGTGVIEYGKVDFGNELHWITQGFYWKAWGFNRGIHANYNGGEVIGNIYENPELLKGEN